MRLEFLWGSPWCSFTHFASRSVILLLPTSTRFRCVAKFLALGEMVRTVNNIFGLRKSRLAKDFVDDLTLGVCRSLFSHVFNPSAILVTYI